MSTRVNNKNPISCAHREPHQLDNHKLVEQIDHDYHVDNSSSVVKCIHCQSAFRLFRFLDCSCFILSPLDMLLDVIVEFSVELLFFLASKELSVSFVFVGVGDGRFSTMGVIIEIVWRLIIVGWVCSVLR